jgi:hypothetical protein
LRIAAAPAERVVKVSSVGAAIRGVQIVRLHIEKHGHDPRQVDLVAVIIQVVLAFGAICYLCGAAADRSRRALLFQVRPYIGDEAEHENLVADERT